MRFELICEGATEQLAVPAFLKRWLDPQLSRPVGIRVTNEKGFARVERKIVDKARAKLHAPGNNQIIAVIGLLDLYGPDYPSDKTTVADRYEWLKAKIESDIDESRFRMHFAVHESEAWLMSDKTIFPRPVRDAWPANMGRPEEVNNERPPAKLLNELYRRATQRAYKKTANGRDLFSKLDPHVAASKCPYLQRLLDDLPQLAKDAGL